MADSKITGFTADTAPSADDLVPTVHDPAGTPANRKVTIADLLSLQPQQNLLINGNMDVWQRNTTATPNDDVFTGADRWNFLTETNGAWTVARSTDKPDGSTYSMQLTNVTLNNQCGIVYLMENKDTLSLDNKTVSLSLWAKTNSTEIANIRATVLTWGSTADSVTSDVIGTWASDGTDPTWATNWTSEKAGANFALTSSWQQFKHENIAIDTATVNNLAVVIWVDDGTIAANDDLFISQVQLNIGAEAGAFLPRPYAQELQMCQRYCYVNTTPADNQTIVGWGWATQTTSARIMIPLHTTMRVIPSLTATAGDWILADSVNAAIDVTVIAIGSDPTVSPDLVTITVTAASGLTQYRTYALRPDGSARTLILSAEL